MDTSAFVALAAYAAARGMTANEAQVMWMILAPQRSPASVMEAWDQLDQAWQQIRASRSIEDW